MPPASLVLRSTALIFEHQQNLADVAAFRISRSHVLWVSTMVGKLTVARAGPNVDLAAKVQRVEVVLFHTRVAFRREFYPFSLVLGDLLFESLGRVGAVDETQRDERLGVAAGGHLMTASARRRRPRGVCAAAPRSLGSRRSSSAGSGGAASLSPASREEFFRRLVDE